MIKFRPEAQVLSDFKVDDKICLQGYMYKFWGEGEIEIIIISGFIVKVKFLKEFEDVFGGVGNIWCRYGSSVTRNDVTLQL